MVKSIPYQDDGLFLFDITLVEESIVLVDKLDRKVLVDQVLVIAASEPHCDKERKVACGFTKILVVLSPGVFGHAVFQ